MCFPLFLFLSLIQGLSGHSDCEPPQGIPDAAHNGSANVSTFPDKTILKYTCNYGFTHRSNPYTTCTEGNWTAIFLRCIRITCSPLLITNGKILDSTFTYGSTVRFQCYDGYELKGNNVLTCMGNRNWDYHAPTCEILKCPVLEAPSNGRIINPKTVYHYDFLAHFACAPGFRLNGTASAKCLASKTWTPLPSCDEIICDEPGPLWLGTISGDGRKWGTVINFDCNANTTKIGSQNDAFCKENGEWSKPTPQCLASCYFPSSQGMEIASQMAKHKSRISIYCKANYTLTGQQYLTCQNGSFDKKFPECKAYCGLPLVVPNATHNGSLSSDAFPHSTFLNYTCTKGFKVHGKTLSECDNGSWKVPLNMTCILVTCVAPVIENRVDMDSVFTYGSTIRISCKQGYKLKGKSTLKCEATEQWDYKPPMCTKVRCDKPDPLWMGKIYDNGTMYQDVIRFSCNAYSTMFGKNETYCNESGKWEDPIPRCLASCSLPGGKGVKMEKQVITHKEKVFVKCEANYTLTAGKWITCDNGSFAEPIPQCKLNCGPPPRIPDTSHNGSSSTDSFSSGTILKYTCNVDFHDVHLLRCKDGIWKTWSKIKFQQKITDDWKIPLLAVAIPVIIIIIIIASVLVYMYCRKAHAKRKSKNISVLDEAILEAYNTMNGDKVQSKPQSTLL